MSLADLSIKPLSLVRRGTDSDILYSSKELYILSIRYGHGMDYSGGGLSELPLPHR